VRWLGAAALVLTGVAACDAPRPPMPRLWTVFDVEALYASDKQSTDAIATDAGLPGGVALAKILDPETRTLFERPTVTEVYNGAYLTTEVWSHFDEVWLQPMYVPIKGWVDGAPQPLATGGAAWIFSVGPDSLFYSPFWQMVYFQVPDGTPVGAIASARQVLDGKYPLTFGPGRTVALVPDDVVPPTNVAKGSAWADGRPVSFLDFGKATFTWNADGVIDEVPIYVFLMRNAEGELVAPDVQTVAGTGPPGSGGPLAPQIENQQRYAAYWRLYTVTLPPAARVFSPTTELQNRLRNDQHLPIVTDYPVGDPADTSGWIALTPACFATDEQIEPDPRNSTMDKCIWLDSQGAIEANVDRSAIQRTDITVTCPFVSVRNGIRVSPVK